MTLSVWRRNACCSRSVRKMLLGERYWADCDADTIISSTALATEPSAAAAAAEDTGVIDVHVATVDDVDAGGGCDNALMVPGTSNAIGPASAISMLLSSNCVHASVVPQLGLT